MRHLLPSICLLLSVLAVLLPPRPCRAQDAAPLNVVFILIDDMGWTDAGYQGSQFYETPHLDRLARQSMRFTNGYAAAPVCSPTRASILTGQYPARLHQTDWIPGRPDRPDQRLLQVDDLNELPLEALTLAEALDTAGYATAHIGKWHLGGEGRLPTDQGFDLNVAGNHRGSPPGYFYPYQRNDYVLEDLAAAGRPGEYLTDRLGEAAAAFIADHRDQPFFLYLSHYAVHTPLEAKAELVSHYRDKAERMDVPEEALFGEESGHRHRRVQNHAVYAAMLQSMDESLGRVMQALEAHGLSDRTAIFFFSDNGGLATSEGWPTTNLPLRAGKGWLYEGGIRVPMLIRWPGVTRPGSTTDVPVSSIDFFPTILEMTGVALGSPPALDGVSLVPLLRGGETLDRERLYWHYPHYSNQGGTPGGAVREGDYKLIEFYEDGRTALYNLAADPGEQYDLAAVMPGKAAALRQHLAAWRASLDARMPLPNPEYAE